MNIKPLPGWVLIEPIEEDDLTVSGVRLPESTQDYPMKGKILMIGRPSFEIFASLEVEDMTDYYSEVNVDSVVYFKKYSGQEIKSEGKILKLVKFEDLLATIE